MSTEKYLILKRERSKRYSEFTRLQYRFIITIDESSCVISTSRNSLMNLEKVHRWVSKHTLQDFEMLGWKLLGTATSVKPEILRSEFPEEFI